MRRNSKCLINQMPRFRPPKKIQDSHKIKNYQTDQLILDGNEYFLRTLMLRPSQWNYFDNNQWLSNGLIFMYLVSLKHTSVPRCVVTDCIEAASKQREECVVQSLRSCRTNLSHMDRYPHRPKSLFVYMLKRFSNHDQWARRRSRVCNQ